jgi:chromosome segregation ATPase
MKSKHLDDRLKAKRAELKVLDEVIAGRKQWQKDQEKLIDECMERGNTQLMGLNHDITIARAELKTLKNDIGRARKDKQELDEDVAEMRRELTEADPGMVIAYA